MKQIIVIWILLAVKIDNNSNYKDEKNLLLGKVTLSNLEVMQ